MRKSRPSVHLVPPFPSILFFFSPRFQFSSLSFLSFSRFLDFPISFPFLFYYRLKFSPTERHRLSVTIRSRFNPAHVLSFVSFRSCPFFSIPRSFLACFHRILLSLSLSLSLPMYLSFNAPLNSPSVFVSSSQKEKREGKEGGRATPHTRLYSYATNQPHQCAQRLFIKKLLAILDCPRENFLLE